MDSIYDDDNLAPVMPAIDAVQQLLEEERRNKQDSERALNSTKILPNQIDAGGRSGVNFCEPSTSHSLPKTIPEPEVIQSVKPPPEQSKSADDSKTNPKKITPKAKPTVRTSVLETIDDDETFIIRHNPLDGLIGRVETTRMTEYEFIPKSVTLDVYSNDPEVKRFLKQLTRIGNEFGYNEQDYKCYSCRRPIGMVFGQTRLCHFDGHHYCSECHLGEKSIIPARILCNWDFNKYPISKRNQHFLSLISNEPMFELKTVAPLLYKKCQELREIEELRCQAFFIRSYCFTCVHDTISFELTKLVWPREHLIKQVDLYSMDDLIQIKSGTLKQVLKNVISFGRQHVLSCMLCCQKGFICELCKSSQIIYPFDTESVYRCNSCQSIYHKSCFKSKPSCDACPRCLRLKARREES